ncbi:MAG: TIGR01212 family radical SAM protein, partial [Clostridia bacterium]|nr:TIGR01212 family radical SAM protein [Clostridia bacterium]
MSTGATQQQTNPFVHSDSNKRYYTYDYYLRKTFGEKCAKIPLDAGFTCPNIDGRCGFGGCIYCSARGSGDFAMPVSVPLEEQYEQKRRELSKKWQVRRCIPYLQAHTNTYGPTEELAALYRRVIHFPDAVGLNIATRADCLEDGLFPVLQDLCGEGTVTVELGLQTSDDETAGLINRGHTFAQFKNGYERLRRQAPDVKIAVHLIFGLPGEGWEQMRQTVLDTAALRPDFVKIHLLHVLKGTKLANMYLSGAYEPMTKDAYVRCVCGALELLPP